MKKLSKIVESLWSDIRKRGLGNDVKQEDAFNPEYIDFGEKTTVYWAIDNLEIDGEVKFNFDDVRDYNNNGWRLPTIDEVNQLKWNVRIAWYEGCKHLKFDDEQELRLKTNGSGGFHMWTKEINAKFPTGAYAYGFDNMNTFNIDSFNKSINKLFVFLVKDKNYVNESVWNDIRKRGLGSEIKEEELGAKAEIDGVKYSFTKDFMGMGEIFNDENSDEWTCFAFNKMPNGSTIISGDTDQAGVFGYDKYDIGDWEYDVYALRSYVEKTKEELIDRCIENSNLNDTGIAEIENIFIDYIEELFEKHMSELAYYWIYEFHTSNSDDGKETMVYVHKSTDPEEDLEDYVNDEFNNNIKEAHQIQFPVLKNSDWDERLEKVLTTAYEKYGFKKSEEYEISSFDGNPAYTNYLCFVKLK